MCILFCFSLKLGAGFVPVRQSFFLIRFTISGISPAGAEPRSELRTAASPPDSDHPAERTPAVPGRQFSGGGGSKAHECAELSPGGGGGCAPSRAEPSRPGFCLPKSDNSPGRSEGCDYALKIRPKEPFHSSKDRVCRGCACACACRFGGG